MKLVFDTTRHHYAFGHFDRVKIDGMHWRPVSSNEVGWVFSQADGTGASHQFRHSVLSTLGATQRLRVEQNYFSPIAARQRLDESAVTLSLLSKAQQTRMFERKVWTQAFLELERERKVNRTYHAITANEDDLTLAAFKLAKSLKGGQVTHASKGVELKKFPSGRSLLTWVAAFEKSGLAGLVDKIHLRGGRDRKMIAEGISLLMGEVRGYMHPERPTMHTIEMRVKGAFQARNKEREAQGLPSLKCPSRETVRRAVRSLDPFQTEFHRYGPAAARKKFAPVGKGLNLERPLQRVEIDEWDIDLIALLAETGVLEWFSDDERVALGLAGKKVRWKLTVAMCATTRCILAMVLTPSAKSSAAIQAIKMVLSDKGQLTTAVKAYGGWHMHGVPEEVVTDNGSAFTSEEFQIVCADLGISATRTVAGVPELRGRIERFFRTMGGNLMSELSGRTFSNIVEKGDSDPGERACLTENDLATILVRWVVDVYHNTEHEGLDGETPVQCWDRLTKTFCVTSPPDVDKSRQIFGQKLKRKVGKKGLRILGVHYHSDNLVAHFLNSSERDLEIR